MSALKKTAFVPKFHWNFLERFPKRQTQTVRAPHGVQKATKPQIPPHLIQPFTFFKTLEFWNFSYIYIYLSLSSSSSSIFNTTTLLELKTFPVHKIHPISHPKIPAFRPKLEFFQTPLHIPPHTPTKFQLHPNLSTAHHPSPKKLTPNPLN